MSKYGAPSLTDKRVPLYYYFVRYVYPFGANTYFLKGEYAPINAIFLVKKFRKYIKRHFTCCFFFKKLHAALKILLNRVFGLIWERLENQYGHSKKTTKFWIVFGKS